MLRLDIVDGGTLQISVHVIMPAQSADEEPA